MWLNLSQIDAPLRLEQVLTCPLTLHQAALRIKSEANALFSGEQPSLFSFILFRLANPVPPSLKVPRVIRPLHRLAQQEPVRCDRVEQP